MVANAVSFLRHPSVAGTPLARRVAFMKRKGLTDAEVNEALARVGGGGGGGVGGTQQPQLQQQQQQQNLAAPLPYGVSAPPQPPPSLGWGSIAFTALMAAGIGAAATYVTKNYVIPWWNGRPTPPVLPAEVLSSDSTAAAHPKPSTNEKVDQLLQAFTAHQEETKKAIGDIQSMLEQSSSSPSTSLTTEISALRSEIQTLKSLMPQTPAVSASSKTSAQPAKPFSPPGKFMQSISTTTIPPWQQKAGQHQAEPGANTTPADGKETPEEKTYPVTKTGGMYEGTKMPSTFAKILSDPASLTDIQQIDDSPLPNAELPASSTPTAPKPWERNKQPPSSLSVAPSQQPQPTTSSS
ncbi:peroxin-14 [Pelomyxa schiedti]|nr:peroxin-14 [Pelomyxa schiedti]